MVGYCRMTIPEGKSSTCTQRSIIADRRLLLGKVTPKFDDVSVTLGRIRQIRAEQADSRGCGLVSDGQRVRGTEPTGDRLSRLGAGQSPQKQEARYRYDAAGRDGARPKRWKPPLRWWGLHLVYRPSPYRCVRRISGAKEHGRATVPARTGSERFLFLSSLVGLRGR